MESFLSCHERLSVTKREKLGEVLDVILNVLKLWTGERNSTQKFVERETEINL